MPKGYPNKTKIVGETAVTSPADVAALQAEVKRLAAALEAETGKRTVAEQAARDAVAAQGLGFLQSNVEEQPTGRTVKVKKATNPWVRKVEDLEFEEVELPTYWLKIDLPPSGGIGPVLNGFQYQNGEVYEVDLDTLRTLKDTIGRSYAHENSIRGSNENAYRRPKNVTISGGERRA